MNTQQAYNTWAEQYDTNYNKTRDLEAIALRAALSNVQFNNCLEIGCGTGKNTVWLIDKVAHLTAIDLSVEMLAKAKEKINSGKIEFIQADITSAWTFANNQYDLVSFSLVLEHIDNLDFVFSETAKALNNGGYVYIGELHPFKQYTGSKARFETAQGLHTVPCFNHHITDFIFSAKKYGLLLVGINEWFDDDDRDSIPRILTIMLQKAV